MVILFLPFFYIALMFRIVLISLQLEDTKRGYGSDIERLQQEKDDLNNRIKKLSEGDWAI